MKKEYRTPFLNYRISGILNEMKKYRLEDVNPETLNAFYIQAQCAVGVFTLMATLSITFWGFSFGKEESIKILMRLVAIVVSVFMIVLHWIFKRWAASYVIEVLYYAADDGYSGLISLISLIYGIKDVSFIQTEIKKAIDIENCDTLKSIYEKSPILKDAFKYEISRNKLPHMGIWLLMVASVICQLILFFII